MQRVQNDSIPVYCLAIRISNRKNVFKVNLWWFTLLRYSVSRALGLASVLDAENRPILQLHPGIIIMNKTYLCVCVPIIHHATHWDQSSTYLFWHFFAFTISRISFQMIKVCLMVLFSTANKPASGQISNSSRSISQQTEQKGINFALSSFHSYCDIFMGNCEKKI